MRVVPQSQAVPLQRIRVNSSTDASFPSRSYTSVIPTSNDGVLDISGSPPTHIKIVPFGQTASAETFLLRVLGWQKVGAFYLPVDLWEGTITLGSTQGSGSWIPATTIAAASNNISLPASVINLTSTSGFASSGFVVVNTSAGPQIIGYSGISGNQLTGCNLNVPEKNGTGTMYTGAPVYQYNVMGSSSYSAVTANDYFATNIVTSVGNNGVDCQPVGPANNQIAHLLLDAKGSLFIECLFNINSSAQQANALVGAL